MYVETRNAKHKKRQHTNKHTNGRRRKAASCRACSVCHCHSLQLSECTQHHNPLRLPTYKRNCGTHARTEQATTQCDDDDDDNDDDDDGDGGGVAMKCCATPIGSLVSTVFECCRATVQSVMLLPSYRARMDLVHDQSRVSLLDIHIYTNNSHLFTDTSFQFCSLLVHK